MLFRFLHNINMDFNSLIERVAAIYIFEQSDISELSLRQIRDAFVSRDYNKNIIFFESVINKLQTYFYDDLEFLQLLQTHINNNDIFLFYNSFTTLEQFEIIGW